MGTALGITGGALITLAGSYWLFVLQRKNERLSFEVLTRDVIIPVEFRPGDSLQVFVRSDVLPEEYELPKEEESLAGYVPAGRVFGFRIRFKNRTEEPLDRHRILIELDPEACIVSVEIEEEPKGTLPSDIQVGRDPAVPNLAWCDLGFLNATDEAIISIQSLRNETAACDIYAHEKGLSLENLNARALRRTILLAALATLGFLSFGISYAIGAVVYGPGSSAHEVWSDKPWGPLIYMLGSSGASIGFLASTIIPARGIRALIRGQTWSRSAD